MIQDDLAFAAALEQARLIRNREVSPLELVQLYLKRIQRLNIELGSYFTVLVEGAIADAIAKTEQLTQSDTNELPLFFGVPISIKDLTAMAGVRCTFGTPALMDSQTAYDDAVVTKIKEAGFVILGKTATSELGSLPYTEPNRFPPARNPWNLDYTAGGSSGGAAAAVAAGLCPLAQASDGGGSIRGPAFCCGLVGIKPARGRVSFAPVGDRLHGLATNGPIARTVADAAALLDVMSGYVTGDPYWLPDPESPFLSAATNASDRPQPLRIGFTTALSPMGEADPICQQAVHETVRQLEALGHQIVEQEFPELSELIKPFTQVWQSGVGAAGIPKEVLQSFNRWLIEQTGSASDYLQSVAQMQTVARRIVEYFDLVDVLVLPTYMYPPIQVGAWVNLSPAEILQKVIHWVAPCPPFNASGQPAIALPTGSFDSNNLPIGIQLVGRPAAEATIINLAAQFEAARPWIQHRPGFALR